MNDITVTLTTLTPLWTGGVDGKSDRLHATGLIGSLRWWYEAIVRGLGGRVCDWDDKPCQLTGDKRDDPLPCYKRAIAAGKSWWEALDEAGICDVCKVFGTTGWRRRFRLKVAERQGEAAWDTNTTINVRPYGRQRGWYLSPGWMGKLALHLTCDPVALGQMAALFLFLERWGGLGAKPQLGYGVFRLLNRQGLYSQTTDFNPSPDNAQENAQLALPNLRLMTFFQARFQPHRQDWWTQVDGLRQLRGHNERRILQTLADGGLVPVSPAVKNHWRYERPWAFPHLKPWLFGTLRRDYRLRSKVNVGWAIRQEDGSWLIPGWVWLPRDSTSRSAYVTLVDAVRRLVEDESAWLEALNLRGRVGWLRVVTFPSGSPWGIKKASLVRTWVGATLEEKDD